MDTGRARSSNVDDGYLVHQQVWLPHRFARLSNSIHRKNVRYGVWLPFQINRPPNRRAQANGSAADWLLCRIARPLNSGGTTDMHWNVWLPRRIIRSPNHGCARDDEHRFGYRADFPVAKPFRTKAQARRRIGRLKRTKNADIPASATQVGRVPGRCGSPQA